MPLRCYPPLTLPLSINTNPILCQAGAEEDELDPTAYHENRVKYITKIKDAGENPYPHKFPVEMQLPQFREK